MRGVWGLPIVRGVWGLWGAWLTLALLVATAASGTAQATPEPSSGARPDTAGGPYLYGSDGWETYGDADFGWRIEPLGGDPLVLERFAGEVLFINLWATWCVPCVRELGSIERLRARLADTDVRFLVVAAESEGPVRRFLRRYRYDLPIFLEKTSVPPAFGLRGLPTSWLVDRDGRIALIRHGEAVWDTDEVEAFVRALAGARRGGP